MLLRSDVMKASILAAGKFLGVTVLRNLPSREALEGGRGHSLRIKAIQRSEFLLFK